MNILRKRPFPAVAIVLLCFAVCYSQDIASDFAQALEMVPQQAKWPSGIMLYDVQSAADSFISKYSGTEAVEFLKSKIEDPNSRKLALLSLAKLAASNEAAESAIYDVVHSRSRFRRDAITAIAYLAADNGRRIAQNLLSQPGSRKVRKPAVDMLVRLGDPNTLQMLKQMLPQEKNSFVKKALESAIPQLQYRLAQVPATEQAEWVQQEILCWRTSRETRADLSGRAYHRAAETLSLQGWQFRREYLEYKLNRGDLVGIAIIGNQKETWAIEGLKSYATLNIFLGDVARTGLGKIGTSEALRALEVSLVPGGYNHANMHIMRILEHDGDKVSAEFMKKLSLDERFSERRRTYFKRAYKAIEMRLSGNGGPRGRGR